MREEYTCRECGRKFHYHDNLVTCGPCTAVSELQHRVNGLYQYMLNEGNLDTLKKIQAELAGIVAYHEG